MPMRDYWGAALQDVLALVEELQGPNSPHELKAVIAFSELPRSVDVAELASMDVTICTARTSHQPSIWLSQSWTASRGGS